MLTPQTWPRMPPPGSPGGPGTAGGGFVGEGGEASLVGAGALEISQGAWKPTGQGLAVRSCLPRLLTAPLPVTSAATSACSAMSRCPRPPNCILPGVSR